jgi:SNF2 family DNA or RNA helicase
LTATPLQNSLLELYGLVSIIDDYAFGDLKSFKSQYGRLAETGAFDELKSRLAPICKRTLRKQVIEYINYTNRIPLVEEFYPFDDEIELYNAVTDYLRKPVCFTCKSTTTHHTNTSKITIILNVCYRTNNAYNEGSPRKTLG